MTKFTETPVGNIRDPFMRRCQVSSKSVYMWKCEIFQQFLLIISQFAYSKEKEKWWRVRDILSFKLILVD